MVEYTKKLIKVGNSFAILVPKSLVKCKVFDQNEELKITLEKVKKAFYEIISRNLSY